MIFPWSGDQCIICLRQNDLTNEHLIPQAIGGRLSARFLCCDCNKTLGAKVDASARSDPSIRLAVNNLSTKIPKLAQQLTENQPFLGESKAGYVRDRIKDREFRVRSAREEDGSLIQPTDQARQTVETILRKSGYGAMPNEEALAKFDQAPENEKIKVAPDLEIIKWSLRKVEHDLSKPLIDAVLPLKIAFEFLACHLGTTIYNDVQQLAEIRKLLRSGDGAYDSFHVDRLNADEYQPYHGLYFEGNDPHARVQIVLFGWLGFRVHFYGLALGGPRLVYIHNIESNEEDIRVLGSEVLVT